MPYNSDESLLPELAFSARKIIESGNPAPRCSASAHDASFTSFSTIKGIPQRSFTFPARS